MSQDIDVSSNGAIKLGSDVTCDGFVDGYKYRVQTHVHEDHMDNFNTSKGLQTIVVSSATRELLEVKYNADLPYRVNIVPLEMGGTLKDGNLTIETQSSGHMLGAVQVAVTTVTGERLGYSGDFSWPLDKVINVDSLVIDSTWGNPNSIRRFTQEEAHARFKELVTKKIRHGPVTIKAYQGTFHHAFQMLDGIFDGPVIASERKVAEAEVYRKHGYCICPLVARESEDTRHIMKEQQFIDVYLGELVPYDPGERTTIILSASWVHGAEPLLVLSDHAYMIGISAHADFNETLQYVEATGARKVVTDGQHGIHAADLALAISERLGLQARPSSFGFSRAWGE